jgi:DEAD/DEAH box helicase domain-containing protein
VAERENVNDGEIAHGDVSVTSVTVMFKKIKFETHENVGAGDLILPELEMHTSAFWYTFPADIARQIELVGDQFGGALRGLANILGKIAPLWVMCDARDLRAISQVRAPFTERPTVFIWENIPGGVGLSQKLYVEHQALFESCLEHVDNCQCAEGCPACVGPPMEVGNRGKEGVKRLLQHMLALVTA